MSGFIKYRLSLALILLSCLLQAQTTSELIRFGDMAYENGNYASAIHFYKMVLDENMKADRNSSLPYEMMPYTGVSGNAKKLNKKAEENDEAPEATEGVKDTTTRDVLITPDIPEYEEEEELEEGEEAGPDANERYAAHQIAECNRLINYYAPAEEWYVRSMQMNWGHEDEYTRDRYWFGTVLMSNSKYQQAIDEFSNYILESNDTSSYYKERAKAMIENCQFAQSGASKNAGFTVTKGDTVLNNGSVSFAASYYDENTILISSARKGSIADEERKIGSEYLTDLFKLRRAGDTWSNQEAINKPINTKANEGAACVNKQRSTMFFSRWSTTRKDEAFIHVSRYFVDRWMKPKKLNDGINEINKKGHKTVHPALTGDGKILFFASNIPGGQGGMDIWYCTVDEQGNPGKAVNLGPEINTPEDEITPFYHDMSRTLYFSSKGHKGIGGFDVFKSKVVLDSNITEQPVNLGFPLNSARNDMYFSMDGMQTKGFVTSNRGDDCPDCFSGNCNQLYTFKKTENTFTVSGIVFDAETGEPIPNSKITIKDVKSVFEPYYIETDENGEYMLPLGPEMHVFMKAQKLEYFADANVISTEGLSESKDFMLDFNLAIIPYEEIKIEGIYYDLDKATLRDESITKLDEMVEFLELNENIIIEISSHTDSRATAEYNLKLSQKRAESVVNYLIEHGIQKERLLAKGYGESKLINKCKDGVQCSEDEHQQNRRTSFRTLSEKFEPITKYRPKK